MVSDNQNAMAHSHSGLLFASTGCQSLVLGTQVGVPFATGGVGSLDKGSAQGRIAFTSLPCFAFASTLVVAGTHPRPRGQMLSSREATHVSPYLGNDHLGRPPAHPRDGVQPGNHFLKRAHPLLDLRIQTGDSLVQVVDVG